MRFNLLMILICVIALATIAFRMGFIMYHPEPLQTYDPSFITYHGSLWAPPINVTSTPTSQIQAEPVQTKVKQCLHVGDYICQN